MSTQEIFVRMVLASVFAQLVLCMLTFFTSISTTILKSAGYASLALMVDLVAMIVCATTMFVVCVFAWDVVMPDYEGVTSAKIGALIVSVLTTWTLMHAGEIAGRSLMNTVRGTVVARRPELSTPEF